MKRYLTIGVALAAAAASAGATTFLAEDFEGTAFPPTGWYVTTHGPWGNGWWERVAGGPAGYYAFGAARGGTQGFGCRLWSPFFPVTAGTNIYYRFDYYRTIVASYSIAVFWLRDSIGNASSWELPATQWSTYTGTYLITRTGSYCGAWETIAIATSPYYSTLSIDDVLIADEPFVAVTPASLGRVKALYH